MTRSSWPGTWKNQGCRRIRSFRYSQVVSGHTKQGLKPCHRPLIAALAEAKLVVNFWLRQGNSACINGAANFLWATLQGLPKHICIRLLRAFSVPERVADW